MISRTLSVARCTSTAGSANRLRWAAPCGKPRFTLHLTHHPHTRFNYPPRAHLVLLCPATTRLKDTSAQFTGNRYSQDRSKFVHTNHYRPTPQSHGGRQPGKAPIVAHRHLPTQPFPSRLAIAVSAPRTLATQKSRLNPITPPLPLRRPDYRCSLACALASWETDRKRRPYETRPDQVQNPSRATGNPYQAKGHSHAFAIVVDWQRDNRGVLSFGQIRT